MEAQELDTGPLPKGGAVAMDTFQGRSRQKGDNSVRGRASGGPPWRVMGKPSQRAPTSSPGDVPSIQSDRIALVTTDVTSMQKRDAILAARTQQNAMEKGRTNLDSVPTDHTSYFSPLEGDLTFPSYRASHEKRT